MPRPRAPKIDCPGGCGRQVERHMRRGNPRPCLECAITVAKDNLRQIAAKDGPAYDKWRESMIRAVDRMTGGSA